MRQIRIHKPTRKTTRKTTRATFGTARDELDLRTPSGRVLRY